MQATTKAFLPAAALVGLLSFSRICNWMEHIYCGALILIAILLFTLLIPKTRLAVFALIGLLALHAQWGVLQFATQHDLGFYLVSESRLDVSINGVAKFAVGSTKIIRAYGPYLHANIFGAAMLIGLMLVTTNSAKAFRTWLVPLFLLGIVLSFSRSIYAGTIIFAALTTYKRTNKKRLLLTGILLGIVLSPLILFRITDSQDHGTSERIRGYRWALDIVKLQPRTQGVGYYPETLNTYLETNTVSHNVWEVAPVHSVPLLLVVQAGFIPALLLLVAILVTRTRHQLYMLAPLIPALLFDHYFLTDVSAFFLLCLLLFGVFSNTAEEH